MKPVDINVATLNLYERMTQRANSATTQISLLKKMLDTQKEDGAELNKLLDGPGQKLDIRA